MVGARSFRLVIFFPGIQIKIDYANVCILYVDMSVCLFAHSLIHITSIIMIIYIYLKCERNKKTIDDHVHCRRLNYLKSNTFYRKMKQTKKKRTKKKTSNYISSRKVFRYILPSPMQCRATIAKHITSFTSRMIRWDYLDTNRTQLNRWFRLPIHRQRRRKMYNTFAVVLYNVWLENNS